MHISYVWIYCFWKKYDLFFQVCVLFFSNEKIVFLVYSNYKHMCYAQWKHLNFNLLSIWILFFLQLFQFISFFTLLHTQAYHAILNTRAQAIGFTKFTKKTPYRKNNATTPQNNLNAAYRWIDCSYRAMQLGVVGEGNKNNGLEVIFISTGLLLLLLFCFFSLLLLLLFVQLRTLYYNLTSHFFSLSIIDLHFVRSMNCSIGWVCFVLLW